MASAPSLLLVLELLQRFDGNRNSLEHAFDDDPPLDDALKVADDDPPAADLVEAAHHDQPVAGHDGVAKPHVLQAAEADHRSPEQIVALRHVAAELSDGF